MTDTNQLTWEKLRRFFEVDNFNMPLPEWYGELFDEFREAEIRKAKAEALRDAAEGLKSAAWSSRQALNEPWGWLRDRADRIEADE